MLLEEIQLTNSLSGGQKKVLLTAINEALAINDELLALTDSIYSEFNDEIRKTQFQYIKGEKRDIKYKTIEISTELKNNRIKILFRCFNVLNGYTAEYYEDKYSLGNAETTLETSEIYINVEFLFGMLRTNVKSLLQHELEHLLQKTSGKRLNSYGLGKRGPYIYNMAYKILKSNTEDAKLFYVAYIIYTLSESETDAFVNQLYQELKSSDASNIIQTLKDSSAYSYYLNSKRLLKLIKNNREEYEDTISKFGFEYEKFLRIFSKLNRRYITKIGKVLVRYNQENQPTEVLLNNLNKSLEKHNPENQ